MKVSSLISACVVATTSIEVDAKGLLRKTDEIGADQYWWKYASSDCAYDDVDPQPACGEKGKGDVTALQKCCLSTTGCGGFVHCV